MKIPIITTKLYRPPLRPETIHRPNLIACLDEGKRHQLILISAPAGFGKTTLISEWIDHSGLPTAWLSLDSGDNDLTRFLVYLVSSLQTIQINIGKSVLEMLQSPQPPSFEFILTVLLNEISSFNDHFFIILDDYHVIETKAINDALVFLIEHLPHQMHLVIATREDPPFPLVRLRARDQLTELRAADLRFSFFEAATFLNEVMGLDLSDKDIEDLENRTEGWITGLQLSAVSMQRQTDTAGFIRAFTGSHRYILDYLVEEVLQHQPEHIRSFLLQTSILDRLCGPLCDAVTERKDGNEVLNILDQSNLFLIPLDNQRQWYRYHHLFAEVLQTSLRETKPYHIPILHRRASEWCKQSNMLSDAIGHAFASEDFEGAADMIERSWSTVEDGSQLNKFLSWAKLLPEDLLRERPVLGVWYAHALLGNGEMEAAEARLSDAEQWLQPTDNIDKSSKNLSIDICSGRPRKMVVVDEKQFRSLPAAISIARAYLAQALGDLPSTVIHAQHVLDLTHEADHLIRGQANALLGIAYWASGDLKAGSRIFADYSIGLRKAGHIVDAISATFVLAYIQTAMGQLRTAISTLDQLIQYIIDRGEPIPPDTAELYRGLGELFCERGDLEAATQYLSKSIELGEQYELLDWQHRQCISLAIIKQSEGDLDGAIVLIDKAKRLFIRTPLPEIRPISALKARIWIKQGKLIEAQEWVCDQQLSVNDTLSYIREFEHITLARLYIARYKNERGDASILDALGLLERLLKSAEAGGRIGSVIEILVLQALAHHLHGNITYEFAALERALKLAEPEGYTRIFVDEGKQMAELLTRIDSFQSRGYILKLLSAFNTHQADSHSHLVEPLSERELEVLKFLRTDLSGPEIALECMVSLSTIRTHTQNIYAKLGVNNRRAAIRRAEQMNLFK